MTLNGLRQARRVSGLGVFCAMSCCATFGQTVSANEKGAQETPNNGSLAVSIEMQKAQVPIGQEPWANLTMKNLSDVPVIIERCWVHVDGKDGEPPTTLRQREMTDTLRPGEFPLPVTLNVGPPRIAPNGSYVLKFQLKYLYDLSAPAKYTVYAEVMDPSSHRWLRTKTVIFELLEKPRP